MTEITFGVCPLGLTGERLLQWRDHLLDPAEQQRIQEHLTDCSTCHEWLAAFDTTRRLLRRLPAPNGGADLWHDVQAGMTQRRSTPMLSRTLWRDAIAVVIVASLVLLFIRLFNSAHPATTAPTPTATTIPLPLRWTAYSRPIPGSSGESPAPVIASGDGKTAYECIDTFNTGT